MQPKALPSPREMGADVTRACQQSHFRVLEATAELRHKTFKAKLHNPGVGFVVSLKACEELIVMKSHLRVFLLLTF